MRFVYSLVRFVPDPARGEFVNVGALVGSEESSEWGVRQIANPERARRFGSPEALDAVWSFLDKVGNSVDRYQESLESLFKAETELSEQWLAELYRDHRNIVQLSYPTPMVAESADDALDRVFELLIVDPSQRKYRFRRKNEALAAVRRAYKERELSKNGEICERVVLSTAYYQELFDFAVTNGEVLQLAHSWSFQVPDQESLARQIKSWGWTVRNTRDSGGVVTTRDSQHFDVAKEIDIEAVYIPPARGEEAPAFSEACKVFEALDVNQVPLEQVYQVADRAVACLGKSQSAGLSL